MTDSVKSKAWDWSQVPEDRWNDVSDEFLPVALRWKKSGKNTALDIGCGRGRHSIFLAEMGFQVTATDLSPEGIAQLETQARQKNLGKNIKTVVCDMLEFPFGNATFDCVVAFHSIFHTDYKGLQAIISGITRSLKDTGRIYVTFNSKNSRSLTGHENRVIDDFTVIKTQGSEKGIPHTYLDYDDILVLMADYRILKIQHIEDIYNGKHGFHYFVEAEKLPGTGR